MCYVTSEPQLRRDARSRGSEHPGQRQARHAPGTWARPSGTACAGGSVLGCGGGEEPNFYVARPSGRRSPHLIARTSLQRQCLPCGDLHFPFTAALVISSQHHNRLTYGGLLFLLIWFTSLGSYALSPYPLRGWPRARALEWESWVSLRRLLEDPNAVVSLCWG